MLHGIMALDRVPAEHMVGRSKQPVISQRSSGTPGALMRIDFHETFRWNDMSRWDMKDSSQMHNRITERTRVRRNRR